MIDFPTTEWAVLAEETRTCETHGDYPSRQMKHRYPLNKPWWTNCPSCDSQWQADADRSTEAILGGLTAKQAAIIARREAANVPKRFTEATVWNWQHGMDPQRKVWNWARDFCQNFQLSVETGLSAIFYGVTGTGKTHLAIGILQHVTEKGGTGYYTTVMDMLGRIKSTYSRNADESEDQVIRFLSSVDLLVIDEVGRQMDTCYETAQLFRLLEKRHRELKPTLLVSNMGLAELKAFLGEPIVDRFREGGGVAMLFDWGSGRKKRKPRLDPSGEGG